MKKLILVAAASLFWTSNALAEQFTIGDLSINNPMIRATPVNAPVSGGYMTITNGGADDDRLIAVAVDFARESQIHEMKMDGDVMKMREIEGGLVIPAGETVVLQPGGFHIMFMKLDQQLKKDQRFDATLTFENAGNVDVTLTVEELVAIKKSLGGDEMKMEMKAN